ncbi:MAG: hypothetical protein ACTSYO_07910, partial [Candidatus Ranarchaeia archaeon]
IVAVLSWRLDKQKKQLIEEMALLPLVTDLIHNENRLILQSLQVRPIQITVPAPKDIESMILFDPGQVLNGPWNSTFYFENPFPFTIKDTDDYLELSGRLLVFSTSTLDSLPVYRILLQGEGHIIRKKIILLSKEKQYQHQLQLLPQASDLLSKLKNVLATASETSRFALDVTRHNLTIIVEDYKRSNYDYIPQIVELLDGLRKDMSYFIV